MNPINNLKKPNEMNSIMEIENSNNSKIGSLVLNDIQLKEVPPKPKIEEKAKPFVLIKEHESPLRENRHENVNKFESYNNRHENNNNNREINNNNHRIENNNSNNNSNIGKVEKKEIIQPEIKKPEIKAENKPENVPKKLELIKENKESSRNVNNNGENGSQNEGKTTHLFKLTDPIEIKSLAQKKSDVELDTPQEKSKPRASNSSKLDKSADDTDSLVFLSILLLILMILIHYININNF